MNNRRRNGYSRHGPRPGDFPLGSWESRAAARAIQLARDLEIRERHAAQLQNLTPLEQEVADLTDDPELQAYMVNVFRYNVIPRLELYGRPLTVEKLRQWRKETLARNSQI